jgi:hypothetical protein
VEAFLQLAIIDGGFGALGSFGKIDVSETSFSPTVVLGSK